MILFTQSTAVQHKYLSDELKLLCYNFSLGVALVVVMQCWALTVVYSRCWHWYRAKWQQLRTLLKSSQRTRKVLWPANIPQISFPFTTLMSQSILLFHLVSECYCTVVSAVDLFVTCFFSHRSSFGGIGAKLVFKAFCSSRCQVNCVKALKGNSSRDVSIPRCHSCLLCHTDCQLVVCLVCKKRS